MASLLNRTWTFTPTYGGFAPFTVQFSANSIATISFPNAGGAMGNWYESPRRVGFILLFTTPTGVNYEIVGLHQNNQGTGTVVIDYPNASSQISSFTMQPFVQPPSLLNTTWSVTSSRWGFTPFTVQFTANGIATVLWSTGVRTVGTWTQNQNTFTLRCAYDTQYSLMGNYQGNQGGGTVQISGGGRAWTAQFNMTRNS